MIEEKTEVTNERTLGDIIREYQTDPSSAFHKLRYHVREARAAFLSRVDKRYGHVKLKDIKAREFDEWYKAWLGDGKIAAAHTLISHLRTIFGYAIVYLEDMQCARLSLVLSKMKFPQCSPREQVLTAAQATAHRAMAHERGWPYMALGQALQFEMMFRQRDIIGEWVPLSEPGISDVACKKYGKWGRGLRWEEIDENLICRHVTSKKQKLIQVNLMNAPMVLEELGKLVPGSVVETETIDPATGEAKKTVKVDRSMLPMTGPVILCEVNAWPYTTTEWRRKWRKVADMAGIPKEVRNADSRAGAITEATEAGAELEHVRHAATHSDISQTQRYSRHAAEKIELVQTQRLRHRFRTYG